MWRKDQLQLSLDVTGPSTLLVRAHHLFDGLFGPLRFMLFSGQRLYPSSQPAVSAIYFADD